MIYEANRWCSEGVDLLASQQLEKYSSAEAAVQALADIEDFLTSATEFRNPNQLRALFDDLATPETKSLISQVSLSFPFFTLRLLSRQLLRVYCQVIQRLQDVQVMCERRANGLRQFVARVRKSIPSVTSDISPMVTAFDTVRIVYILGAFLTVVFVRCCHDRMNRIRKMPSNYGTSSRNSWKRKGFTSTRSASF